MLRNRCPCFRAKAGGWSTSPRSTAGSFRWERNNVPGHTTSKRDLVRGGQIGQIVAVRMWSYRNVMPGFGSPADCDPPPELDYDMWLGPAPRRPYNPNRAIYHFRWFWDYSGGQMTNLGQHALDIVHWYLDATAPAAVTSAGGRFALKDNGETPDTQDVLFEYPGHTVTWSQRECSIGAAPTNGLEFCGTRGSLKVSRRGFVLTPDPKVAPDEIIPRFGSAHPVGGPATTGQREVAAKWTQAREDKSGNEFDQFKRHARNFLDCVRSRHDPISDLEGRTASPPRATWLTCRFGWAESCTGIPCTKRSWATPRLWLCSNGRTERLGTPNALPS